MADRRQPFTFRFWGTTRRTPDTQTPTPPPPPPVATSSGPVTRPALQSQPQPVRGQSNTSTTPPPPIANSAPVTKPTIESQPISRPSTISTTTTRPTTETQNPPPPGTTNSAPVTRRQSTANPTSTSPPKAKTQAPSPLPPTPTTKSSPNSTPTAEAVSREPTTTITTPFPPAKTADNNPPNPTPQPISSQIVDQTHTTTIDPKTTTPKNEVQTDNSLTNTLTSRIDKPKTPSQTIEAKSPSSSKPPSPTLRTPQSRSPPHPLSPSRPTPQSKSPPHPLSPSRPTSQSRSITSPSLSGNSKTPFTPQRTSQPRSPSLLTSRSPKQTTSNSPKDRQLGSPSIKPRQIAQEASGSYEGRTLASKEKDPKPETSQQEPQLKAKVESDSVENEINGVEETKFKRNEMKEMPSRSTELGNKATTTKNLEKAIPTETLDSSTINDDQKSIDELKTKPEDIKDVKEVAQENNVQANEEAKKEVSPSPNPKFGFEEPIVDASKTPRKPDEVHTEKQHVLEREGILHTSIPSANPTNNKTHQQPKQNSAIAHDKSTPEMVQHIPLNKEARDVIPTFVTQMAMRDTKNSVNDRNVSIITLAGENRGASMQMGPTLKEGPLHIHRGYKAKPDESSETSTDGEGSSRRKQSEDGKVSEDQPTEAYVNNNAQGINNSIVFNASIAERSPGVHMVVTHVPREPISPAEGTNTLETRKAEFSMSRAEKLTYEPTVRRRCLRGLFLETSDSDPETPEKPRRHGCRVGCELKSKENGIDII